MAEDYDLASTLAEKGVNISSDTDEYDLASILKYTATTTTVKQAGELKPAVSDDESDIDPRLERNNTPFQDITRIAGLIERTGIPTKWEQSFPCPCINPTTGQPRADCQLCHGRGTAFRTPYMLQIAFQANMKGAYNGEFGVHDTGTTIGTPQVTENGIENGISFRDRLTIEGLTLEQSYVFNVSTDRTTKGLYLPYHVVSFDYVLAMKPDDASTATKLTRDVDFTYDNDTSLLVPSAQYVGYNITMDISVWLRYYVADISKETRYAQVKKQQDKKVMMGNGDKRLTNYFEKYADYLEPGILSYRMPKKLLLKREDLFIGATNFTDTEGAETPNVIDAKLYDSDNITDFLSQGREA